MVYMMNSRTSTNDCATPVCYITPKNIAQLNTNKTVNMVLLNLYKIVRNMLSKDQ